MSGLGSGSRVDDVGSGRSSVGQVRVYLLAICLHHKYMLQVPHVARVWGSVLSPPVCIYCLRSCDRLRSQLHWDGDGHATPGKQQRNLIMRTSLEHGHYGEGGRFARLSETAAELTFLISEVESTSA